jgi:hypothetical protein
MKYERWATCHDPQTKRNCFLAIEKKRVGFTFGDGENWPDRENLPVVAFSQTVKQLQKRLAVDIDTPIFLAMNLLRDDVRGRDKVSLDYD